MNEKRQPVDPLAAPESRTRSDVAPKSSAEPVRHESGFRAAVQVPVRSPTVPPPPLTPEDLLEDGWDDDEDSGPTLLDPHGTVPEPEDEEDDEFDHDDFPTRQTPMALQDALLAYPLPSDSERALHAIAPSAPPADETPKMTVSADETAEMPNAPPLPDLDDEPIVRPLPPTPVPPPAAEQSQVSHVSQLSMTSPPFAFPRPTTVTGKPVPQSNTVRFAFLRNLSPNDDPPVDRLVTTALISFFATLVVSGFVLWIVMLLRH